MSKQSLQKRNLRFVGFLAAAIMFVFGVGTNVSAQTTAVDPPTTIEGTEATVPGRVRTPTPEEMQALTQGMEESLSRSTEGLEIVDHPEGYQSVDLQGRFMNLTIAKRKADGTIVKACVSNIEEAKAFLKADATPSAVKSPSAVTPKTVASAGMKKTSVKSTRKTRKASRKG